ncbi:efflux transporter, RND family, MFP subunit [Anaeromyxobacter dehalogenans 2CP-1]|uniref:Efflux transporter, RND family, MFP subunit n=1 Tax=Anaeromyxobacter dehalogenans (strain ATCC BAA-258 / DSM 21875 / 2CP-1) TaxID=455488 RepID=B8J5Z6_ANAD2|nr:efflux RND transporter periplasmic adaptor subunit [Anaeromyxobacter dehalogenans]ACL66891.1 efflux transporter, RND family, MFP subunit [Anaeromyxobacter dehalogenans 2CP-1]
MDAPASPRRAIARLLRSRAGRAAAGLALALAAVAAVRAARGPAAPGWAVERRPLVQRVVASGRVMAPARIQVGAVATGKVAAVRVDEGDAVRAGDLLVQLDDAEARAALSQARAQVLQAAARLEQSRGPAARGASEALRQAELRVELAERARERARSLSDAGSASVAQLDDAEQALALARSARESALAQAAAAGGGGPDQRLAEAALAAARGAEEVARARLEDRQLRAPAAATVILRDVEPGDTVTAGARLLVLARTGETRLSVEPDEKNLALLRQGQPARAVADAFPDAPFDAAVSFLAPSVDPARGTVEVRLAVPAPPPFLRPDMTVSVNVEVGRKADALVLPADAVRDAGGSPWVLAVRGGRAERRAVRLGLRGDALVEIAGGLAAGDEVLAPSAAVAEGSRVRVRRLPGPELGRAL